VGAIAATPVYILAAASTLRGVTEADLDTDKVGRCRLTPPNPS